MTLLLSVLVLTLAVFRQANSSFDCRRPQQSCVRGDCMYDLPTCQNCDPALYSGDDCGLEINKVGIGACVTSDPCVTGTCYDEAGTATCYCDQDHYGVNCEYTRFDVACSSGKMVIGANPETTAPADLLVYIEGQRGTAACEGAPVPDPFDPADDIPDTWMGQYIDVDDTSADCGAITGQVEGDFIVYKRNVVVLYNRQLSTSTDNRLQVTCKFNKATGVIVESDVAKLDTTDFANLNPVDTEDEFNPVTLTVLAGGVTLDPTVAVQVGTELTFTFQVPAQFSGMKVLEGEGTDNNDPVESLQIITGSCMADESFQLGTEAISEVTPGDSKQLQFKMKAFHFSTGEDVKFIFNVRVCLGGNSAECDATACPSQIGGVGYGRKKREADNERIIERIIRVVDPNAPTITAEHDSNGSNTCSTYGDMTAGLIAMGIVIFTLLILLCVLISKLLTSRSSQSDSKQDLYSTQSVQSLPRI